MSSPLAIQAGPMGIARPKIAATTPTPSTHDELFSARHQAEQCDPRAGSYASNAAIE